MGRATRWLRSLLGSKKESKNGAADDTREKWRQSFKSARDSLDSPSSVPAAKTVLSAAWVPSMDVKTEKEQSKHAIAVAAATAAATDAAITAAQAAVALVQHTNTAPSTEFCGVHEYVAAVTIQRVFRGFLAKKALRALKALVKLQALVRGYLIRKQAAATFHRMQALIRAQEIVRAQKSRAFLSPYQGMMDVTRGECANLFHRRSIEKQSSRFDGNPKIVPADPWCRRLLRRTGWSLIESLDEISPSSGSSPRRGLCPQRTPPHDCRPCFNHHEWSSTAQTTPRCIASPTPTKSVCGWGNCPPNYMINTRSFEAKVRSKSAPKQRPGSRQRIPLSEVVVQQARSSLSGVVGMNRTQESFNLKNATVGRLDGSLEVGTEGEEDYHLHMQNW